MSHLGYSKGNIENYSKNASHSRKCNSYCLLFINFLFLLSLIKIVIQSIVQERNLIALTIKEIFVPPTVFLYASGTL